MKIEVLDYLYSNIFQEKLENMYKTYNVVNVHYDVVSNRNNIHYIAIVEYKEKDGRESLEDLNLSNRSYNALKRNGVNTVDELKEAILSGKFKRFRNLGIVSQKEIEDKLSYY